MARTQSGFTFVGLMILIALLAIASMATLTSAAGFSRRAAENELLAIGEEFNRAFLSYYNQTPGGAPRYPGSLTDLVRDPRYPGVKRHLRRVYPDPLTGKADWGLIPAPGGGIMGVYSLAAGQPMHRYPFGPGIPNQPNQSAVAETTSYREWQFGYLPAIHQTPTTPAAPSQSAPLFGRRF
jgi:type II secretory pathway pseudopilin PulG